MTNRDHIEAALKEASATWDIMSSQSGRTLQDDWYRQFIASKLSESVVSIRSITEDTARDVVSLSSDTPLWPMRDIGRSLRSAMAHVFGCRTDF